MNNVVFSKCEVAKINRLPFVILLCLISIKVIAQENIATVLGYPADSKLLIIHADDLGVSQSENEASFKAIEEGVVNSASVMMPTPWVLEVADYAKRRAKTHDFGLHLVLSSEWKNYKWGPVSSVNQVSSLVDEHGYFHEGCTSTIDLKEAELELRAQIDRAYAMGLEPTHLDSHMGCLFGSKELTEIYLKLGQHYNLPVLVNNEIPEALLLKYDVKIVLDKILTIVEDEYAKGSEAYYINAIRNLKPGVSTFLIHTGFDNQEMRSMTIDHPDWGSEWRQRDFDFFTSEKCKKVLEDEKIILITWRQLKDAYYDNPK